MRIARFRTAILVFVLLLLAAGVWLAMALLSPVTITVNPKVRHQTMAGWQATHRMWEDGKLENRYDGGWLLYQDAIIEGLADAGIDRLQVTVRSGFENPVDYWPKFVAGEIGYREYHNHRFEKINDNADPNVADPAGFQFSELDYRVEHVLLPLQKVLAKRGRRLAVQIVYVDFASTDAKGTLSHADHPEEYAELIQATFDRLKTKYGVTPDYLELVLEPDNTDRWRGRQIGEAAVAVTRRLHAAGYFPKLVAPSTCEAGRAVAYLDAMLAVPGARQTLSAFSYHRYDRGHGDLLAMPGIRWRAEQLGLPTAMHEHVDGDFDELIQDLTITNVSSWEQWAAAGELGADGQPWKGWLLAVDTRGPPAPSKVQLNQVAKELSQVFAFVDTGAVRIGAMSSDSLLTTVAFQNPDGRQVVVTKLRRAGRVTLKALRAGDYGARLVTPNGQVLALPGVRVAGRKAVLTVPERGVLTVYGKAAVGARPPS